MTKQILTIVSLFVLLSTLSCGSVKYPPKAPMLKHIGDATVALVYSRIDTDENPPTINVRTYCTGVWVGEKAILTAYHCVDGVANHESTDEKKVKPEDVKIHYIIEGEVTEVGQEPSGIHLGHIAALDKKHDLALVRADGKAVPAHSVALRAEEMPAVGEAVYVVGQARGMYWSYTSGIVSAYRGDMSAIGDENEGPYLQVTAAINNGNSGGGIFNKYGELVGIADFKLNGLDGIAFCLHLDRIKPFLTKNHAYLY
jgi:S1-C subfamily serine protease